MMQLVEQHRIDRRDPRWQAIDEVTFASKHLYNAALYVKRQAYIHESNRIIPLMQEGIGTLVIGKNDGWKQAANIGKKNNQSFVFIPHVRFIEMLAYKAELVGIHIITLKGSHTSKCSFLDLEPIGHHDRYLGKRVKRGLFRARSGQELNADINGSYNILRRFAPDAFPQGIASCVLRPIPLRLLDRRQDRSKQHVGAVWSACPQGEADL